MALLPRQLRECARGGVESWQVAMLLRQQPPEARYALVVGCDRRQARVIEAVRDPLVIDRVTDVLALLEGVDLGPERRQHLLLALAHPLRRGAGSVERGEPRARAGQQLQKLRLARRIVAERPHALRRPLQHQPALKT